MPQTCPLGSECPFQSTTSSKAIADEHQTKTARVIVIVERPMDWNPASELDVPPTGRVLDVVDDIPITDPATFIRQYNALSLDENGNRRAALARPPRPEKGKTVVLVAPSTGN